MADFIQPSLGPLQPNLDDFMDTLEPLQGENEISKTTSCRYFMFTDFVLKCIFKIALTFVEVVVKMVKYCYRIGILSLYLYTIEFHNICRAPIYTTIASRARREHFARR